MAIFNNSANTSNTDSKTTIITGGSHIKGEMELSCNLYIDGVFEGKIHSSSSITIGKHGKVNGEVIAKKCIVQGLIEGHIDSDRIEILANGMVKGSILSKELIIEAQGGFEGESKIKTDASTAVKKDKVVSDSK